MLAAAEKRMASGPATPDLRVVERKMMSALLDEASANAPGSASEVDSEVDDAGSSTKITIQGIAEMDGKKDKKRTTAWVVLVSGSLFWYRSQSLEKLKGDMRLQGVQIKTKQGDKELSVVIEKDGKQRLALVFKDSETCARWAKELQAAVGQPPADPPSRVGQPAKRSLGLNARSQKAIAGKVGVTALGKSIGMATLNEEAKLLIASVKALIASVYDSKTANTVENNIIKLVVKYHFLVSAGAIEEDAWLAMDGGLREAFKWGARIADNIQSGRKIPDDIFEEWVGKIQSALRVVEAKLYGLMEAHVQAKTLGRIGVCFDIFTAREFLDAMYRGAHVRADAEALTSAMERYLAFQF